MDRTEIFEQPKEDVRDEIEQTLSEIKQRGDGYKCDEDAVYALNLLRERKFFKSGDRLVSIKGPIEYYNHKLGGYVKAKHHTVGQINDEWVIDMACQPKGRVFYDMSDYLERSGIKIIK